MDESIEFSQSKTYWVGELDNCIAAWININPHTWVKISLSKSTHAWLPYICLLFSGFANVYHSVCVWPTALNLGCITKFDMLFLVMGFISLINEIHFMLISSHHICIRSKDQKNTEVWRHHFANVSIRTLKPHHERDSCCKNVYKLSNR